jgi:hypothetical protein
MIDQPNDKITYFLPTGIISSTEEPGRWIISPAEEIVDESFQVPNMNICRNKIVHIYLY